MEENKILETDRLLLRKYSKKDLRDLYEYLSDEEVVKYEPYKAMDITEVSEELNERIDSDEMIAVVLKETDKLIGNIYLGERDFESLLNVILAHSIFNLHTDVVKRILQEGFLCHPLLLILATAAGITVLSTRVAAKKTIIWL